MWDFVIVLALAVLPAAGNTIGSLLAEGMHTPKLVPRFTQPPALRLLW